MKVKSFAGVSAVALAMSLGGSQAPPIGRRRQPAAAGAGPAGAARPPQALVPVAASTLAASPDQFVGMTVTLTAAVDQRYGGTAFSIDQDRAKSAGQDVLVLAPLLNAPVEPNAYVTVIGEVVRFDAADAAARMKDAMPVLGPEVVAKYRGRAGDHRHLRHQRRDDRPRQAPAAADVAGGARAEQGDEAGRPGLHRAPPVGDGDATAPTPRRRPPRS